MASGADLNGSLVEEVLVCTYHGCQSFYSEYPKMNQLRPPPSFRNLQASMDHVYFCHCKKGYVCDDCLMLFPNLIEFQCHARAVHPDQPHVYQTPLGHPALTYEEGNRANWFFHNFIQRRWVCVEPVPSNVLGRQQPLLVTPPNSVPPVECSRFETRQNVPPATNSAGPGPSNTLAQSRVLDINSPEMQYNIARVHYLQDRAFEDVIREMNGIAGVVAGKQSK